MNIAQMRKELAAEAKSYKAPVKRWSDDENQILKEFYGKVNVKLIAQKIGRSVMAIQNHMKELR